MKKYSFLLLSVLALSCQRQPEVKFSSEDIHLIPKPERLVWNENQAFVFSQKTKIFSADSLKAINEILVEKFKKASGFDLKVSTETISEVSPQNAIVFKADKQLKEEEYRFSSTEKNIEISASTFKGFSWGMQTLLGLLPKEIFSEETQKGKIWAIPSVEISDQPQYAWRGLMLDVSRHFFSKDYIFKTIERMAMLKINTLHLHLVDNEGWRIEIKKYPKLTEVGAWRVNQEDQHWNARKTNDPNEKGTYGGFFTQEDIKDIVAYAQKYAIEVVPEIELPAHTMSAIAAYPFLSCHKRPIAVPSGGVWPITDIYCAGQEETFEFLQNVLDEVMTLFPTKYIHIGGDEATHTEWEKCPKCLGRMKDHQLKNAHELQSYFIKRIDQYLKSKNKQLIGWDEIIDGGLSENAVVMNWRGVNVVKKSIDEGHRVILTSNGYIDQYQGNPDFEPLANGGNLPISRIYSEAFAEKDLTQEQRQKLLGAQANLWAEYVPDEKHSEYMIFPRLFALSEVFWTEEKNRNWEDFSSRVSKNIEKLDILGVNYATSMYQVRAKIASTEKKSIKIALNSEIFNADIRYLIDEYDFSEAKSYQDTIFVDKTTKIKAATFKNEEPYQNIYENEIVFHKGAFKKVDFLNFSHKNYQGQGESTLTNVVRGSKDFHDKQWLGWLGESATLTIDLEEMTDINKVVICSMENQGHGIYFPVGAKISVSENGKDFKEISSFERQFKANPLSELKNFEIKTEAKNIRFVKIEIQNLSKITKRNDTWLFIDEIQIF